MKPATNSFTRRQLMGIIRQAFRPPRRLSDGFQTLVDQGKVMCRSCKFFYTSVRVIINVAMVSFGHEHHRPVDWLVRS